MLGHRLGYALGSSRGLERGPWGKGLFVWSFGGEFITCTSSSPPLRWHLVDNLILRLFSPLFSLTKIDRTAFEIRPPPFATSGCPTPRLRCSRELPQPTCDSFLLLSQFGRARDLQFNRERSCLFFLYDELQRYIERRVRLMQDSYGFQIEMYNPKSINKARGIPWLSSRWT